MSKKGSRESAVTFYKAGGHSHDGVNSSKIDFSKYTDKELSALADRLGKFFKASTNLPYEDSGAVEGVPEPEGGHTGQPYNVVLTTGTNDDGTGWISAEWEVYGGPAGDFDDDDQEINFMEGSGTTAVDDTDTTPIVIPEAQSAEAINEFQVSIWKVLHEPTPGVDHEAPVQYRKFYRTDEQKIRITPVEVGKLYHVRVRGVNSNGVHSDPADETVSPHIRAGAVDEIPDAPTGVTAVATGPDSIMITWDESTHPNVANGAGTYRVQCDTTSAFTSVGGNPLYARSTGAESTTFTGLAQDTEYYFRVKAKPSTGTAYASAWGPTPGPPDGYIGPITTDTLGPGDVSDGVKPSVPSAPTVYGGPNYLYVRWSAVTNTADPITYKVYVSTSTTMSDPTDLAVSVSGTSTMVTRLPSTGAALAYGVNYYVKIEAVDIDGSNGMSAASSAAQLAQITTTDIGPNSITSPLIVAGTILGSDLAITTGTVDATFQSSAYSAGSAGWKINSDGSMELNNLTARGTIQAGGATTSNPYVKVYASGSTGQIDLYPGETVATVPAVIKGASDSTDMWLVLKSPAGGSSPNPVTIKLITDKSTQTKSQLKIDADTIYSSAREEQIVFKFSQNISRSSLTLEQLDFAYTDIIGGNYWSMYSATGTENYITLPRIGQYLVSWNAYWDGASANSTTSGKRGSRTLAMSKGSSSAPGGSDYWLHKEVITPFPDSTDYTWQTGAASGSIMVRAAAGDSTDYLRFWTNNYMVNAAGTGESGNATCYFIISVIRISA